MQHFEAIGQLEWRLWGKEIFNSELKKSFRGAYFTGTSSVFLILYASNDVTFLAIEQNIDILFHTYDYFSECYLQCILRKKSWQIHLVLLFAHRGSVLVQLIAFPVCSANTLPDENWFIFDWTFRSKLQWNENTKYSKFHSRKRAKRPWKYHLQNDDHLFQASLREPHHSGL